jgi:Ca2+/Na+ antiporter
MGDIHGICPQCPGTTHLVMGQGTRENPRKVEDREILSCHVSRLMYTLLYVIIMLYVIVTRKNTTIHKMTIHIFRFMLYVILPGEKEKKKKNNRVSYS